METIENKSKVGNRIFYTILVLLILGSVGMTFNKIVIQKNYQIEAETTCDPTTESCFHYDGVVCDGSDIKCVPEEVYDYKYISKKASNIALCEATEEKIGCDTELSCIQDEVDCSYTFCTESNVPEGETCSSPIQ